jgi:hypothetical protein
VIIKKIISDIRIWNSSYQQTRGKYRRKEKVIVDIPILNAHRDRIHIVE